MAANPGVDISVTAVYEMVLNSATSHFEYLAFGADKNLGLYTTIIQPDILDILEEVSYDNISLSTNLGNTTPAPVKKQSDFYQNEQVGFLIFLFIGILIGNTSVLLEIGVSKRGHKSPMTFFIMHLAISDLLVGFVSVLTDLIWKVTVYWYAGNVMCHIVRYLQGVVMFASTYVLVALSIDRLEAIARPMSFSSSRVRARILITLAWVLSALMALPMVVLNKEVGKPGHTQCGMKLPSGYYWQLYLVLLASALFFIPTLIISICYCVIISVIWSKSKVLNSSSRAPFIKRFSSRHKQDGSKDCDKEHSMKLTHKDSMSSSRGVIPQAKIRTIKMTLVIIIVFIVCWSPFFIFNILDVFGYIPREPSYRALRILIQSFAPLNSLANPIIYGVFTTKICQNLRRIKAINWLVMNLCCCFRCSMRGEHTGSLYTSHTYMTRANSSSHRLGRSSSTSTSQNNRNLHGNNQCNNHSFHSNSPSNSTVPQNGLRGSQNSENISRQNVIEMKLLNNSTDNGSFGNRILGSAI